MELVEYEKIHSNITKNIWISGWEGSIDKDLLIKNNIKTIICLNNELRKTKEDIKLYKSLGITHHYIQLDDLPNVPIDVHFDEIYNIVVNAIEKGAVLVHCTMGISRSVTAVISVILKKCIDKHPNVTTDSVLDYIQKRRPCANPNPGFYTQLKKYERKLSITKSS